MGDEPPPAAFVEVAALERPERDMWSTRRQFADIVCGVEFTLDGRLLASAGVAKQVSFPPRPMWDCSRGCSIRAFIRPGPPEKWHLGWLLSYLLSYVLV